MVALKNRLEDPSAAAVDLEQEVDYGVFSWRGPRPGLVILEFNLNLQVWLLKAM